MLVVVAHVVVKLLKRCHLKRKRHLDQKEIFSDQGLEEERLGLAGRRHETIYKLNPSAAKLKSKWILELRSKKRRRAMV